MGNKIDRLRTLFFAASTASMLSVATLFAANRSYAAPKAKPTATAVPIETALPPPSLYSITATEIDGKVISLSRFKGDVLLVVNTASNCGFTPQYHDLETIYAKYSAEGFEVLGFPSNDFENQEPGSDIEIKKFCALRYGVTFPLFKRAPVSGPNKQAVFKFLTETADSAYSGEVAWNFEKFIIGRDGTVRGRFGSFVNPGGTKITNEIELLLAEPKPSIDTKAAVGKK